VSHNTLKLCDYNRSFKCREGEKTTQNLRKKEPNKKTTKRLGTPPSKNTPPAEKHHSSEMLRRGAWVCVTAQGGGSHKKWGYECRPSGGKIKIIGWSRGLASGLVEGHGTLKQRNKFIREVNEGGGGKAIETRSGQTVLRLWR